MGKSDKNKSWLDENLPLILLGLVVTLGGYIYMSDMNELKEHNKASRKVLTRLAVEHNLPELLEQLITNRDSPVGVPLDGLIEHLPSGMNVLVRVSAPGVYHVENISKSTNGLGKMEVIRVTGSSLDGVWVYPLPTNLMNNREEHVKAFVKQVEQFDPNTVDEELAEKYYRYFPKFARPELIQTPLNIPIKDPDKED